MDKIAITRRRCARGALLTLLFGSPSTAIMARTLEYALMQDDPHISSEIGSHLFYLADKGYVRVYLGDEPCTLVKDPQMCIRDRSRTASAGRRCTRRAATYTACHA